MTSIREIMQLLDAEILAGNDLMDEIILSHVDPI